MNSVFTQITGQAKYWCGLKVSGDHWETMKYAGKIRSGRSSDTPKSKARVVLRVLPWFVPKAFSPEPHAHKPNTSSITKANRNFNAPKRVVDFIWKSFRSSGHLQENLPFPFGIRKLKGKKERERTRREGGSYSFVSVSQFLYRTSFQAFIHARRVSLTRWKQYR